MLKVQEIREIIKLIDESSIQEFEYESGESKVTLKKQGGVAPAPAAPAVANTEVQQTPAPAPAAPQKEEAPVTEEKSTSPEAAAEASEEKAVDYDYEITSPMVGTIYHAPSPEDDPYVQAGDKVSDDSVVCIVEAMKLFNEIEAEVSGEIVEVLVSDGELVEYNQPLFRVKR